MSCKWHQQNDCREGGGVGGGGVCVCVCPAAFTVDKAHSEKWLSCKVREGEKVKGIGRREWWSKAEKRGRGRKRRRGRGGRGERLSILQRKEVGKKSQRVDAQLWMSSFSVLAHPFRGHDSAVFADDSSCDLSRPSAIWEIRDLERPLSFCGRGRGWGIKCNQGVLYLGSFLLPPVAQWDAPLAW